MGALSSGATGDGMTTEDRQQLDRIIAALRSRAEGSARPYGPPLAPEMNGMATAYAAAAQLVEDAFPKAAR